MLGTSVGFNYSGFPVPSGLSLCCLNVFWRTASFQSGSCHSLWCPVRGEWVSLGASHSLSPQLPLFHLLSAEIGWEEQGASHSQGPSWNKAACESERGMRRTHKHSIPHTLEAMSILAMMDGQSMSCLTFLSPLSWHSVTCKLGFLQYLLCSFSEAPVSLSVKQPGPALSLLIPLILL